MKCHLAVAVLAVCFVAAYGGKLMDDECVKKVGLAGYVEEKLKKGEDLKNDEKLNCYYACALKKAKAMKEDGSIDKDAYRSKIPSSVPKETADLIMACFDPSKATGKDACDIAGKIFHCLVDTKGLLYIAN